MTVAKAWKIIEKWLNENTPDDHQLADGADQQLVEEAEAALRVTLPKQMRDSYLRHNGSNRIWIFDQGYLMPLFRPRHLSKRKQRQFEEVVDSATFMKTMLSKGYFEDSGFKSKPRGPIKKDWWNENWIPITCNDCGDHLCVDLSPAKGGKKGQVIDWWHERGATRINATSFAELLADTAQQFVAGRFSYDEKSGTLKKAKK